MVNIVLKGMDVFLAKDFEEKLTTPLAKLMNISEHDIMVIAYDSMIFHSGIDQTSMHLCIDVECERQYAHLEDKIATFILKLSKQFAIHTHLLFKYFESRHLHEEIDHQYPLYLDNSNIANVETSQSDENTEIFEGNIFSDYEHIFPNDDDLKNGKKH